MKNLGVRGSTSYCFDVEIGRDQLIHSSCMKMPVQLRVDSRHKVTQYLKEIKWGTGSGAR